MEKPDSLNQLGIGSGEQTTLQCDLEKSEGQRLDCSTARRVVGHLATP